MSNSKKYKAIFITIFTLIFVFNFLFNFQNALAQSNEILITSTRADMIDYADTYSTKESNSSISVPVPSSSWNITRVDLNFTDIKLEREVKTIEDNNTVGFATLGKDVRGMGVQINISEPTRLFGVYIYGVATSQSIVDVTKVQITGYNSGGLFSNSPNKTIYSSTDLNMSNFLGWYLQMFRNPIDLAIGQYYLILNVTTAIMTEGPTIYWFYNDLSAQHPELHVSFYVRDIIWHWTIGKTGMPFLHKLIQRTDRKYFPESIEMVAELNDQFYNITDGTEIGTGNLTVGDINYNPNDNDLNIQIYNNNSVELLFNLSYHLKLTNAFIVSGLMQIQENFDINWTLTPEISRVYLNHSIRYDYPHKWGNLKVIRDDVDITSQVQINTIEKFLLIPNNTIVEGATWEILANSPNVALTLNTPKLSFEQSQDLKYSVFVPVLGGNITFLLFDSLGFEIDRKLIPVSTFEIVYSYNLSANPNEGNYIAYAFWNNLTAAGVKLVTFSVNIDRLPLIILITVIVGSVSVISGFTTYKVVKKIKKDREAYQQSIFNKYMDILNLEYLIVMEKNSGINIFDKKFAAKTIDTSLISGFLEAIRNFGIDLTGSDQQSQTIKLEYQNSKILMSDFKNFRMTQIMKESPSNDFLESIKQLSYDIEKKYGKDLESFDGEITKFMGIKELIEHHLPVSLIYPLRINEIVEAKLTSNEKELINSAQKIMKQKGTNYFFVSNLISQKGSFQAKEAEMILKLIEKKVFEPSIDF